jgi:hypothetical protein
VKKMICKLWVACPRCTGDIECNHRKPHDKDEFCNRISPPSQFSFHPPCQDHNCLEIGVADEEDDLSKLVPV